MFHSSTKNLGDNLENYMLVSHTAVPEKIKEWIHLKFLDTWKRKIWLGIAIMNLSRTNHS